LVCELCGSSDFTKDQDDFFICDFCRTKYTSQQAKSMMVEGTVKVDRGDEVQNLLKLASSALDSQNPGEAYDYANRALEIDTNNIEAWIAKGKGAGWSSNLQNLRLSEMLAAFRSAEKLTEEDKKGELRTELAETILEVCQAVYQLSLNHSSQFAIGMTWFEHANRCDQILVYLEVSYEWSGDRKHLDFAIGIATSLVEGMDITTDDGLPGKGFLQPEAEERMRAYIFGLSEKLRKHDSDYVTPAPSSGKPACFVVTATMGSETAFAVITLREFRDSVLSKFEVGKRFINWYYKNGPKIAEHVEKSMVLRVVSLVFVVAPAMVVAWIGNHANFATKKSRMTNRSVDSL